MKKLLKTALAALFVTAAFKLVSAFDTTVGNFPDTFQVAWGLGKANIYGSSASNYVRIQTANADRFAITSAGLVGIGTNAPLSALDINGGLAIGSYAGSSAAPSNGLAVSGAAGIGTAAPLSKLDVSGAIAVGSFAGATAAPSNGLTVSGLVGIGTAVPNSSQILEVGSGAGGAGQMMRVSAKGLLEFHGGTAPALSSCGTAPSVVSGSDQVGDFTLGSSGVTTCTLTFNSAFTNTPHCFVNNRTSKLGSLAQQTASTLVVVGTGAGAFGNAADIIDYLCVGHS